jgi:chromosome segregation ATPase
MADMTTKQGPPTSADWLQEVQRLTAETERLQRENGSLARTYAACEQMLRERTAQLNQADSELERLRDFAKLVVDMRNAQKAYFRDRRPSDLTESKRLEKLVDQWPAQTLW